ncbi:(2Fe-2S)-binding protein [Candidatus Poribacteria bacterium]|nr:(2Fe-2S)-binding protein [Candidatus Poribacteria bacterium]
MKHRINLTINGDPYELLVEPRKTLLRVLRDTIGLTGAKESCSTGDCGACTVLLDGKPVTSCLVLAVSANGKAITTVEGLASEGELHPIQRAFVEKGGIQCGYCTPGMLLTAKALLDENPNPTEEQIRRYLAGNICRCTGYNKIVQAVTYAAQLLAQ